MAESVDLTDLLLRALRLDRDLKAVCSEPTLEERVRSGLLMGGSVISARGLIDTEALDKLSGGIAVNFVAVLLNSVEGTLGMAAVSSTDATEVDAGRTAPVLVYCNVVVIVVCVSCLLNISVYLLAAGRWFVCLFVLFVFVCLCPLLFFPLTFFLILLIQTISQKKKHDKTKRYFLLCLFVVLFCFVLFVCFVCTSNKLQPRDTLSSYKG